MYFTISAYEAYVENIQQKQNPMLLNYPHPSSPNFILDTSYHICIRSPLLDPSYTIHRQSSTEYGLDYLSKSKCGSCSITQGTAAVKLTI